MRAPVTRRLRLALEDGNRTSLVVAGGFVAAGFATFAVTWSAVAERIDVALQLPYLVSGGFTGLALVAVGLAVINVQTSRRSNAQRRDQLDQLLDGATVLATRLAAVVASTPPAPTDVERATSGADAAGAGPRR